MRKIRNQQLPLTEVTPDHPKAKELTKISEILDSNSSIYASALQDLGVANSSRGAKGMTAEQVVRAAIIKQMEGYSYRELEFHLEDSRTYTKFCKVVFQKSFKKSALQKGIKAISEKTWEEINKVIVEYAGTDGIEKGQKIRVDCTVVESNIHAPYDSELLVDATRVLARLMKKTKRELPGIVFAFSNHCRRAKNRNLEIMNAKNAAGREKPYKDLIEIAENSIGYGEKCLQALNSFNTTTLKMFAVKESVIEQLRHYISLSHQVVCQTRRRVLNSESVPASEKIVSIFEEHTDIIRKDRRDTYYGHKICVTGGASNLILDCVVLEGNPADSVLTTQMLDRQNDLYGRYPSQAAFDGGFTSQANLKEAKEKGVKDVCFSKGRGLTEEDMCRSKKIYKELRKFRAGIESGISWLKRSLGLSRCTWKGFASFKSYVWASIVSANLLTLARKQLA